jgi:hypothetical protein
MQGPTVEILVDQEGKITFEVQGVKGGSCTELTRELQARMGVVTEQKLKPEHFERPPDARLTTRGS